MHEHAPGKHQVPSCLSHLFALPRGRQWTAASTNKETTQRSCKLNEFSSIVKLLQNFHDCKFWRVRTAHHPVDQKTLTRESFYTAATTVMYGHFVNYIIASKQMADVQSEGILYRKPALLFTVSVLYSICLSRHRSTYRLYYMWMYETVLENIKFKV